MTTPATPPQIVILSKEEEDKRRISKWSEKLIVGSPLLLFLREAIQKELSYSSSSATSNGTGNDLSQKKKLTLNDGSKTTTATEKEEERKDDDGLFMPRIICAPCNSPSTTSMNGRRAGGFSPLAPIKDPETGLTIKQGLIRVCSEEIESKEHLEDVLAHELIHFYDHVTVKNLHWPNPIQNNPSVVENISPSSTSTSTSSSSTSSSSFLSSFLSKPTSSPSPAKSDTSTSSQAPIIIPKQFLSHLACTELRAITLSRECSYSRELRRGNFLGFSKHFQTCVRRRAILGVMQGGGLSGEEGRKVAEREVLNAWEGCFYDTSPFDEIY